MPPPCLFRTQQAATAEGAAEESAAASASGKQRRRRSRHEQKGARGMERGEREEERGRKDSAKLKSHERIEERLTRNAVRPRFALSLSAASSPGARKGGMCDAAVLWVCCSLYAGFSWEREGE